MINQSNKSQQEKIYLNFINFVSRTMEVTFFFYYFFLNHLIHLISFRYPRSDQPRIQGDKPKRDELRAMFSGNPG